MKRLPEKLMIAAIILSCGFVMQSEPTPKETMLKEAGFRARRMEAASQAAMQGVRRVEPSRRGAPSSD